MFSINSSIFYKQNYTLTKSIVFSTVPTLNFLSSNLTVVEGVDKYIFYPLQITNVPAGGLEGLIEYALVLSPNGASKKTQIML